MTRGQSHPRRAPSAWGPRPLSGDQGEIAFGPLDSVYLAPGWHYRLENVGAEEAFFVDNMISSQE